MPEVFFFVLLLGAIFFGVAALIDVLNRRESEARVMLKALGNLQVGLFCLAGALLVFMPAGWLLLTGALALISGLLWLGYEAYLMFW